MAVELLILNDEQLRDLGKVIYYQEVDRIKSIQFDSELELAKYLRDSKTAYEYALELLDAGSQIANEFKDDKTRGTIADDIFSYLSYATNFALQTVQNYTLRNNYLNEISEHSKALIKGLQELDPENVTNVQRLAKDAVLYRNAMLEYTRKYQSPASRNFSKWLKDSGIKFDELVQRYQNKLEFEGPFKDLEDFQKLKVYNEVISASGRGNVQVNEISTAMGIAGFAVLILTAGMMVWDIFTSDRILQTVTRDAIEAVASVGGAMVGEVVGAALATELVGAEASALFVLAAGIIGSIAGIFIVGAFVGWLVGLIFSSGGSAPLSTDGLRCYVQPMPDGVALAFQIAHQG
ncbi:hypothetical protein ACHQM5_018524 [Ranunculus cassubicifolius]